MSDYNLDDTDKDIITLWRQGLSSSAIGKNLGITRNSVAGRVFRMRRAGIEVDVRTSPIKKPHVFFPQKISATVIDDNLPILSMKMDMCRFVMNDGSPRDFIFCGKPTTTKSYCAEHHAICYVKSKPRGIGNNRPVFVLKKRG